MATVIDAFSLFLVSWLLTWALLMIVYLGVLALLDHLAAQWQRFQRARQYRRALRAELMRIDRETVASVERVNSAFMLAQRLVRDQADAEHRRNAS